MQLGRTAPADAADGYPRLTKRDLSCISEKQFMSRPPEIEQWSNAQLIHPLSRTVATAFIKMGISANSVSLLGLSCLAGAALLFAYGSWPFGSLAGIVLLFVSHVLDGADGQIARATGTSSRVGEIIDGLCDYVGYGFLYWALYIVAANNIGRLESLILIIVSLISHVLQANFYESRRRQYCFHIYGTPWIGSSRNRADIEHRSSGMQWLLRYPVAVFLAISDLLSRETKEMEYVYAESGESPGALNYKCLAAKNIKIFSLLGQNTKSLAFGIAMFFQCAICYFIFVSIFLNIFFIGVRVYEKIKWKEVVQGSIYKTS